MPKLKICVYAICKDEEKFVDRWMDSMCEADLVVVTDTGSQDGTVERLRQRGAEVHVEEIKPWRFDVARNRSLTHVPQDADVCVCTDLDELFEPGWRARLEEAWEKYEPRHDGEIAKKGSYLYNWSFKPDGSPDVQFNYFKVHARQGFQWICPVHEHLRYMGAMPLETVFIEGMVLNHYPDASKSRGSYLPLLEMAVEEAPGDDRMRYYLGREYMYKARWQDCIDTLTAYLALPTATWNEERSAAMRWVAASYHRLGGIRLAYSWYYKAIAEAPYMREPLVEFARLCNEQKDWPMVFFLAKSALDISSKSLSYINMGYAWDHTPDDLCALAAFYMELPMLALEHAKRALAFAPGDTRLQDNVRLIEEAIAKPAAAVVFSGAEQEGEESAQSDDIN